MKFFSDTRCPLVIIFVVFLAGWAAGCTEEQNPNPCHGVTCSSRGECTIDEDGKPLCVCEPPYKTSPSGKECLLVCENAKCAAHGTCTEMEEKPHCICNPGYAATTDGLSCVKDGDPCHGIDCCGSGVCKLDGNDQPYCECSGDTAPNQKNPLCCTDPCEVVDICMRPTAVMCKEEDDCCGFGICKINNDGEAECDCEVAYKMDEYDRTCCVRTGEPLETGQICANGTDCKTNFCLIYSGDETGYCSKRDCKTNSECRNYSNDGKAMCCEDLGGENYICFKLGTGCNCGDSSGGCGASCTCQSDTACGPNFVCLASSAAGLDDPNAYCSMQCNTNDDCNECEDPDDPNAVFSCEAIGGGQKYCQPQTDDACSSQGDCIGTDVCIPIPTDDLTDLVGLCATFGELESGAECDEDADPNDLPASERCAGFYCLYDHCSEMCEFDADCPEGMRCGTIGFRMDEAGVNVAYVGMCMWFEGSMQPCEGLSDCPDGELCNFYVNSSDEVVTLCVKENCDVAESDCLAPGTEDCGDEGSDPCWGDLCLTYTTGESFCSLLCGDNDDCTTGTICGGLVGVSETQSLPICVPFSGSGDPCMGDDECPTDEVCTLTQGLEGYEAICDFPNDPSLPIGAECGDSEIPCYNNFCVGNDSTGYFCLAYCRNTGDCPTGFDCEELVMGQSDTWGACMAYDDGSADPCVKDADCPTGEACFYNQTPFGELESWCSQAHDPGKQIGEACGGGDRCYNDMCYDATCSAVCDSNTVCSAYGRDCVWYKVLGSLYGPACMPPDADSPLCSLCQSDADCAGDAECIESSAYPGEKYCGLPCPNGDECPVGYTCSDVGGAVDNCRPDSDTCDPSN